MNRIYRLCWNASTSQWVAASELARGSRPVASAGESKRAPRMAGIAAAVCLALGAAGAAHAGQTGGQIVSGAGSINQNGAITTINQNSQHLSLNWQTFDIGSNETVNFVQPGRDSIAVNRILGNSASEIYGNLNANGQVWLINPNGVLFGQGAQVNVGGLVASTLDTSDASLNSNTRTFSGNSKASVVNKGSIRAADGGYVAMLGNTVSNQGTISAQLGTVAMGGGSQVTLTFAGSQLMHMQVDRSTLNNLVENRQLVQADGGRVFMTAGAADALLASVVNNSGVVRAQTVENRNGEIVLLAGMTAGQINVGGTLDASAPNGGNGGTIETSGAFAHIGAASVNASAPHGKAGTWLIDPYDLTIDADAAATISGALNGGTNVTEQTTNSGTGGYGTPNAGGVGDINVNAAISWNNAAATLTLDAYRAINVNASINGAGRVVMKANGNGGNGNITLGSGATVAGGAGVTLTAANNFINQAGANALSSASGKWLVYSNNPTQDVRGGLAPQFIQYNAAAGATPLGTGNGFLYKVAPTVTITGLTGTVQKTYDGTTDATLSNGNFVSSGLINGDRFAAVSGTYGNKNAGNGILVTSPGSSAAYSFVDSTGVQIYGYGVAGGSVSGNIGLIDPRQLNIAIINNPTKTYNGTTTATLNSSNYLLSGLVAGESVTFGQPNSVGYDLADAGTRNVIANFVESNFVAGNGTLLSNYALPTTATGLGTINKAKVQLSGLLGNDKIYDGTLTASLDKTRATLFGVIAADTDDAILDSTAGAGLFANANVGSNKSVITTGFQLVGSKASNYDLVLPTDVTASITPRTLTISGISALSRSYDATYVAALALGGAMLNGLVDADSGNISLLTSGATGTFATRNVGNGIGVSTSGFSLSGSGSSNYKLTQPNDLSANITPAQLNISITGNPTRTYNGTANAALQSGDVTITGFQGAESGTVSQSAGATYASKNAGISLVTALLEPSDFSLGSDTLLSNYTFPTTITGNGTITKAPLLASLVNNPTKTYDGTTDATLNADNYQLFGFIAGEGATVTQTHGLYALADAGQRNVTVSLTDADFAVIGDTLLSNYDLPTVMTGMGTIIPKDVAGYITAGITGPTRAYNGSTLAALTSANFILYGFLNDDGATVNQTVGTFASKNVGKQAISATLDPSNFVANAGTNLANYHLPDMAYGTGEITKALLTASITGNPTKVYDGTTYLTLLPRNYIIDGFAPGEGADVVPSTSINYDTKNVGVNKQITALMAVTSFMPNSQTLLSNYELPTMAQGTGAILAAPLYVLGVTALNKTYDTTTGALLNSAGATLVGLVEADTGSVTLTRGTTGVFANADAGNGKAVTALGFSISGTESGNYVLQPVAGLTANINPYTLTINGVSAIGKIYDGSTIIGLNTAGATLSGVFASDAGNVNLDASGASGSVRSADAANGLNVTTSGFDLSGSRASNYRIDQVSGLTTDIGRRTITASITGNPSKPYDGSNSVTLTAGDYTLDGFIAGQGATVPQSSSAKYNSVNAGTGIGLQSTLSVSDFLAASGTNLSNYVLPTSASGVLGTITPFIINLTGTRVYDATIGANASLFTTGGTIAGVNNERLTLTGSGNLVTKNVGSQRAFLDLGTLALGNNTGSATNYTLVGGTDWVTITPATLNVTGTLAADKIYDQTLLAQLSGATLQGVLGSDAVTLGDALTGTFSSKDVGSRTVTTHMTVSGDDIGNYILQQPVGVSANITPKTINPSAIAQDKQYDGTIAATASVRSDGVFAGDTVNFASTTRTFDGKDVASGRTVTVSGITKSGGDAGNYVLSSTTTTTTASITPRVLNLSGGRVYDTTMGASANTLALGNLVAGETLLLSGSGALSSKNVGTYTASSGFGLGTLALGNNGAALASNYTLVGGTDTYTITPAALTVVGTVAADKIYDGNRNAVLSGSVLQGRLGSDDLVLQNADTGLFDTKDVGTGKAVTTSMTVGGDDAGNYVLTQPGNVTANITSKVIHVVASGVNKVYDGTLSSQATLGSADLVAGDDVSFTSLSNLFADKNVANGIGVTVTGIGMSGANAGNYSLGNTLATTTANITPYVINLVGTRVYDATTTAAANKFGSNGVVAGANGETLTLSGAGNTASRNVAGYNRTSSGTGDFDLGTLALTGNGSAQAGNYTLVGGTDAFTITPYALTIGATAQDKVYDANTLAQAMLGITGLFGGDSLTVSYGSANFDTKNVGSNKTVAINGIVVGGEDAGNYSWNTTATTTAAVTPKTIVVDASGSNKVYDGNALASAGLSSTGIIDGDQVSFTGGSTLYSDKNAANNKTITVDGIAAAGDDAGNYVFNTSAQTKGNITPRAINGDIVAGSKTYDGNVHTSTQGTLTGVLDGDTVSMTSQGLFADKNAGNNKTVNVSGALTGDDAGNYTLTTNDTTTADIYRVVLNLSGTRVYDGTAVGGAAMFGNMGVIAGIAGESLTVSGAGILASKNVATNRALADLGSLSLTGNGATLADNYTLLGGTHVATVTPLAITAGITADDKVYDGNTSAITHGVLTGVIAGDDLALSTSGRFGDKNAANGKTVGVNGSISGEDAGNYVLTVNPTTTASISKLQVAVTAQGNDKYFDGNAKAIVNLGYTGVLAGDVIAFGATSSLFSDAMVGDGKAVSVTGIYATGADAGNYAFNEATDTTASIKQNFGQGPSANALAQVDGVLGHDVIATPYGMAAYVTSGPYSGNHKKTRQPVEKNLQRADFHSGLSLSVVDGGVRLPADALH